MTSPDDTGVADGLHRLAALGDPVPPSWRDAALVGVAWTTIPAEPARLAYDSVVPPRPPPDGPWLSCTAVREVRYAASALAVELELDVGADMLRLLGRLVPARRVGVAVLWPEGREESDSDEAGAFRFDDLPVRPLCIVVGGSDPVKTGWVVV
jgi:hypothetical protein